MGDLNQMRLLQMLAPGLADQENRSAQSQNNKGKQASHRAGDWICIKCNNLNYSFRNRCNRCQVQTKKQNLLDNLLLIHHESAGVPVQDENAPSPDHKGVKTQNETSRRVPFGDLTNQIETSPAREAFKTKALKKESPPQAWTPFSQPSKSGLRKLSNHQKSETQSPQLQNDPVKAFQTGMFVGGMETPKKEKNTARLEQGGESPVNGKDFTKYLFDSEGKERPEMEAVNVSHFSLGAEKNLLDVLFDLLHQEAPQNTKHGSMHPQFNTLN